MALRQAVLGMERASFFYGSARVFGGVTFLLDGARTALVGENGTGKSTLLKCLTGELELNGGKVIRSRGLRLGSVPQDVPPGLAEAPVRDFANEGLCQLLFFQSDEPCEVSYSDRKGKYQAQKKIEFGKTV